MVSVNPASNRLAVSDFNNITAPPAHTLVRWWHSHEVSLLRGCRAKAVDHMIPARKDLLRFEVVVMSHHGASPKRRNEILCSVRNSSLEVLGARQ